MGRPGGRRNLALAALATACALAGAASAPAAAAPGDGPYTPFPEDPTERARKFLDQLNRERLPGGGSASQNGERTLSAEQLEEGVTLEPAPGGRRPAARKARSVPFEQAGVTRVESSAASSPVTWPFAALAAVLGCAALALRLRSRRS